MINYQLTVTGRVQGVGFRWSCCQLARQMGLTGFVRNLANGQVYIEVQGPKATAARFIKRLDRGLNPWIRVRKIQQKTGSLHDYGPDFLIRR